MLLPFKPKRWVTCQQLQTLKDAIGLMEVYMSAEAGVYLMKNLKRQATRAEQGKNSHKVDQKPPWDSRPTRRHKPGIVGSISPRLCSTGPDPKD